MKRELNKWQFVFILGNSWATCHHRTFVFGLFKLVSFPERGAMITKQNYKGFLIDKQWIPKEIKIEF